MSRKQTADSSAILYVHRYIQKNRTQMEVRFIYDKLEKRMMYIFASLNFV